MCLCLTCGWASTWVRGSQGEGRDGLAVSRQARQHRQQAARVDSAPRSQRQTGPARGHLFPRVFNHPRLKQSCSSWPGFLAGYFSFPHTRLSSFSVSRPRIIGTTNMGILFAASPHALGTMLMSVPFTDRPPCHCVHGYGDAAGVRGSHFWGRRQISPGTPEKSFVWHCRLCFFSPAA